MYNYHKLCIGLVLAMSIISSLFADDGGWELKTDKKDVKVFVRKAENSAYFQFRAVTTVKTNLNSLVNMMRDMDAMDKWLETCRDPVVISEPDDASRVIHMKNDSPFPIVISNRDLVLMQRFRRESDNVIVVDLIDHKDDAPSIKGYVRGEFNGHWKFTKLNDSDIEVEYTGLTDPGGSVPASLANLVVVDVPFKTMIKIRKILNKKSTKYDKPITINSL